MLSFVELREAPGMLATPGDERRIKRGSHTVAEDLLRIKQRQVEAGKIKGLPRHRASVRPEPARNG